MWKKTWNVNVKFSNGCCWNPSDVAISRYFTSFPKNYFKTFWICIWVPFCMFCKKIHIHFDDASPDQVKMVCGSFIDPTNKENRKCSFYYKLVEEIIVNLLNQKENLTLQNEDEESFLENIDWCDILIAGDHGQGSFKLNLKLLVQMSNDNHPEFVRKSWIAQVDCQKDTREVLFSTISSPINKSLECLKRGLILLQSTNESGKLEFSIKLNDDIDLNSDSKIMKHIPINLYMTGDLAFYSLVLGKENMSGHWCWRCDLKSRECKI